MFSGGSPVGFVNHDGFRMLPGFHQIIGILMLMEGIPASYIDHFDIGVGHFGAIEINGFAWIRQTLGNACYRNR
ncbi:Uncharacterised protein [Yersinia enterocolitica]|nr:Uncharacterised protein [Yersinia enterocolitica]